jgi:hypothetical protein
VYGRNNQHNLTAKIVVIDSRVSARQMQYDEVTEVHGEDWDILGSVPGFGISGTPKCFRLVCRSRVAEGRWALTVQSTLAN